MGPRNLRVCFKTDRMSYWGMREEARRLGLTLSGYVYWLTLAARSHIQSSEPDDLVEWIVADLGEAKATEFRKAVEKGVDAYQDDNVPW